MKKLSVMLLTALSFAVLNGAPGSAQSVLNRAPAVVAPKLAAPPARAPAPSLIKPNTTNRLITNDGGSLINNGGSTLVNRNASGIVATGGGNLRR